VNFKLATATLGAALVLAGSPAFASAADMQAGPIRINNVQIYGRALSDDNDFTQPAYASISFTNEYESPATDIVFVLENDGYIIDRFDDAGTFAKGVTVSHRFPESRPGVDQRVAVEKVTFADGTTWSNDQVSAAPQPAPAVGVRVTNNF
jgi:hypothetical protein